MIPAELPSRHARTALSSPRKKKARFLCPGNQKSRARRGRQPLLVDALGMVCGAAVVERNSVGGSHLCRSGGGDMYTCAHARRHTYRPCPLPADKPATCYSQVTAANPSIPDDQTREAPPNRSRGPRPKNEHLPTAPPEAPAPGPPPQPRPGKNTTVTDVTRPGNPTKAKFPLILQITGCLRHSRN